MIIERTDKEIIFRLPASTDIEKLQQFLNALRLKELAEDSKATSEEANQLAKESKMNWWAENKSRFIKFSVES